MKLITSENEWMNEWMNELINSFIHSFLYLELASLKNGNSPHQ